MARPPLLELPPELLELVARPLLCNDAQANPLAAWPPYRPCEDDVDDEEEEAEAAEEEDLAEPTCTPSQSVPHGEAPGWMRSAT